jgi:hypothetical protein
LKVFISWSGNSKATAHAIFKALPTLFDSADPWISVENRSGSMWLPEIDKRLSSTDFGIVCVSKANQHAPWINFEAGALSRRVDAKRELMPVLLIDFDDYGDVEGPITGFQMKMATPEGFFEIMNDLNQCELGPKIGEAVLRARVEAAWPEIEKEVNEVRSSAASTSAEKRADTDKLDEVLEVVRGLAVAAQPRVTVSGLRPTDIDSRVLKALDKSVADIVREDFQAANPQVHWSKGSDVVTVGTQGALSSIGEARIRGLFESPSLRDMRVRFMDLNKIARTVRDTVEGVPDLEPDSNLAN